MYATARSDAERFAASRNLLTSIDGKVWTRFIEIPEGRFDGFYNIWCDILCMIYHGVCSIPCGKSTTHTGEVLGTTFDITQVLQAKSEASQILRERLKTRAVLDAYVEGYCWTNEKFAAIILEDQKFISCKSILINDFHFNLLPRFLKSKASDARIAFFLHVPFPKKELLSSIVPTAILNDLSEGMCLADVVGFQTRKDATMFCELSSMFNRTPKAVRVCPVTVDVDDIESKLQMDHSLTFIQALRQKVQSNVLFVRAERIDRIKGLLEGLLAFRLLLRQNVGVLKSVHLFIVAQPSRLHLPEHKCYYDDVRAAVRGINEEFHGNSTWDGLVDSDDERALMFEREPWPPVVLFECSKPHEEVFASFAAADVGVFSSIVDGMNLAIKEFAVCKESGVLNELNRRLAIAFQGNSARVKPGIAIASRAMGSYEELANCVIGVSESTDPREIANAMGVAIEMIQEDSARVEKMADEAAGTVARRTPENWLMSLIKDPAIEQL